MLALKTFSGSPTLAATGLPPGTSFYDDGAGGAFLQGTPRGPNATASIVITATNAAGTITSTKTLTIADFNRGLFLGSSGHPNPSEYANPSTGSVLAALTTAGTAIGYPVGVTSDYVGSATSSGAALRNATFLNPANAPVLATYPGPVVAKLGGNFTDGPSSPSSQSPAAWWAAQGGSTSSAWKDADYVSFVTQAASFMSSAGVSKTLICPLFAEHTIAGAYPWQVTSAADAANMVTMWQRVVPKMRAAATSAGITLLIAWCPGAGDGNVSTAIIDATWPGDAYVDIVGFDAYGNGNPFGARSGGNLIIPIYSATTAYSTGAKVKDGGYWINTAAGGSTGVEPPLPGGSSTTWAPYPYAAMTVTEQQAFDAASVAGFTYWRDGNGTATARHAQFFANFAAGTATGYTLDSRATRGATQKPLFVFEWGTWTTYGPTQTNQAVDSGDNPIYVLSVLRWLEANLPRDGISGHSFFAADVSGGTELHSICVPAVRPSAPRAGRAMAAFYAQLYTAVTGGNPAGSAVLQVSASADRSAPFDLDFATLVGSVYIFAVAPAATTKSVVFYLDGSSTAAHTEMSYPYDYAGTATAVGANPTAAGSFGTGRHVIRAVITPTSGPPVTYTAAFTV